MEDHPNAELARRMCKALRLADSAAIEELFAPEATLHVPGQNPLAGFYKGPEAIAEFAAKRRELSGGTFKSIVHDALGSDRHTFLIERFMAKKDGRKLDVMAVSILHVIDGEIAGSIQVSGNPYAEDKFWS